MKGTEFHQRWIVGSFIEQANTGVQAKGHHLDKYHERHPLLNADAPWLFYSWCHDTCRF